MSWILDAAEFVQNSDVGVAIAESTLAFPLIEGTHLLGLSLSVGLLFLIDLRLIGWFLRDVPLVVVLQALRRYVLAGFALVFASGSLLFWSEAATVLNTVVFPLKLLFILLAGLNALYFDRVLAKRADADPVAPQALPLGIRLAGVTSLLLWTLVIICGRLIPYVSKAA